VTILDPGLDESDGWGRANVNAGMRKRKIGIRPLGWSDETEHRNQRGSVNFRCRYGRVSGNAQHTYRAAGWNTRLGIDMKHFHCGEKQDKDEADKSCPEPQTRFAGRVLDD